MIFFTPVFVLFLEDKFGLDDAIILQTIYVVALMLFEVPAGIFADRYGKKHSLVLGSLILTVSIFMYGILEHFTAFAVAEFILGIGTSLISGTTKALLSDTLKALGREGEFQKIVGEITHRSMLTMALSNIVGGLIAQIDMCYTFWATAASALAAMSIALKLQAPKIEKSRDTSHGKHLVTAAKALLVNNRALRYVMIVSLSIYLLNQMLFNIYQPYLKTSGLDLFWIGLIFASFHVVTGTGAKFAFRFEKRFGFWVALWILLGIVIVSIFLLANVIVWYSFLFIYLQQLVRGIRPVIVSNFIRKSVSQSHLTTALSIESFLASTAYIPLMALLSYLSGHYTLAQTINTVGFIAIVTGLFIAAGSAIARQKRGALERM